MGAKLRRFWSWLHDVCVARYFPELLAPPTPPPLPEATLDPASSILNKWLDQQCASAKYDDDMALWRSTRLFHMEKPEPPEELRMDAEQVRGAVQVDTFDASQHGIDCKAPEGGKPGDAMRLNSGKPEMHLLPPLALMELGRHYGAGARKYAPNNWLNGGNWSVCLGALERHVAKWKSGQDVDDETTTHHMAAVAWNALTLLEYAIRGIGTDDRPPPVNLDDVWPPRWCRE